MSGVTEILCIVGKLEPETWRLAMTQLTAQAGADALRRRGVLTRKGRSPAQGLQ